MKVLTATLLFLFYYTIGFCQAPPYFVYERIHPITGSTIDDSIVYTYSGGRDGEITGFNPLDPVPIGIIKYDSARNYSANLSSGANPDVSYQIFDAANNILKRIDKKYAGATLENSRMDSNTYDAFNNLLTTTLFGKDGTGWWSNLQFRNSYDLSNRLIQNDEYWSPYPGMIWTAKHRQTYTYTGSNLTNEVYSSFNSTSGSFEPYKKTNHIFISGVLIADSSYTWSSTASSWVYKNSASTFYTYNSSGQLISKVTPETIKHTYTYNSSGDMIIDYEEYWSNATISWIFYRRHVYDYDINHKLVAEALNGGTSFVPSQRRYKYVYTANNKLAGRKKQMWDGSSWIPSPTDSIIRVFPGTFTNIKEPKTSLYKMYVYPTLASGVCTIDMEVENISSVIMSIHSADGRLQRQWKENGQKKYRIQVPIANLTNGIYFVSARQENQQILQKIIVTN